MRVRSALATGLGRATSWGLTRLLKREASQLPGRVALGVDGNIIAELAGKLGEGALVVCGTNGKTTTNNILASALEASGKKVLCNRAGANMAPGVAAALLPGGEADWAVIEADELSCPHILPALKPHYMLLLNLFRDQLDRAGEIDHVQDIIVQALAASPTTTLLVDGDDPISCGVALKAQQQGTRVLAFGIGEDLHLPADRVPEGAFCQVCGAPLTYAYRSYAQLGKFACPHKDFARPKLDFVAHNVKVSQDGVEFDVMCEASGEVAHLNAPFGGIYMVYNLLGAFAAAQLVGVDAHCFNKVLMSYHPKNGRLQHFVVGGREVILNLAKNPTGFNQNISLLLQDTRKKSVFFVINDNYNDGRDISWIWDVDFERLQAQHEQLHPFAGGFRANDVQVRMKYTGMKAPLAQSVSEVLEALTKMQVPLDEPLYVLTNYSALWPAKAELEKIGEQHA